MLKRSDEPKSLIMIHPIQRANEHSFACQLLAWSSSYHSPVPSPRVIQRLDTSDFSISCHSAVPISLSNFEVDFGGRNIMREPIVLEQSGERGL